MEPRRRLCVRGHEFHMLTAGLAVAQVAIGTINFAFVAATLHQLFARAVALPEVAAAYGSAGLPGPGKSDGLV